MTAVPSQPVNREILVDSEAIRQTLAGLAQLSSAIAHQAKVGHQAERFSLAQGIGHATHRWQSEADCISEGTSGRPYKGLLEFRLSDAAHFFGRDNALKKLLELVKEPKEQPLMVIHAESGAGKSSLLQAGLIPQLLMEGQLPLYIWRYDTAPALTIKRQFLPDLTERRPADVLADTPAITAFSPVEQQVLTFTITTLRDLFNLSEIQDIALEMSLDYEELTTDRKNDKVRDLVLYVHRTGRIRELLGVVYALRPHIRPIYLPETFPAQATTTLSDLTLRQFLQRITAVLPAKTKLTIILDQFETFFTELPERKQILFVRQLADCLDTVSLPVQFVLALRTEYFGNLANFRPTIRTPFAYDFRLNRLTTIEATVAFTQPLSARDIHFSPGLENMIIADLADGEEVSPPQLQLVGTALYESLPVGEKMISQALYTGQGRVPGILGNHLDRVLRTHLPAPQRPVAVELLGALVTPDVQRIIRTKDELAAELTRQNISTEVLENILNQLVDNRLLCVRHDESDYEMGYQLAHDYLAEQIELTPEAKARKAAAELLARQVINWRDYGVLMPPQTLPVVGAQREQLNLDEDAQRLIGRSALATGIDLPEWLTYFPASLSRALLLEALDDSEPAIQARATRQLVHFFDDSTEKRLIDLFHLSRLPEVRGAALGVLAKHNHTLVHQLLLEALDHNSSERRYQAARGLRHHLDKAVTQRLFKVVAEEEIEKVWAQALETLATDQGESFVGQWQSLRQVPFGRKAAVYDKAQAFHIPFSLPLQVAFAPARITRYLQKEGRKNPVGLGFRFVLPVLLYLFLAFWQGWWPFLEWEAVAGIDQVSYSALALAHDGGLYAGTWDYGLGYLSPDREWADWRNGNLPTATAANFSDAASNVATLQQLAVDPIQPNRLVAAVYEAGVWRSEDQGVHWVGISTGQVPTDVVYLGLAIHDNNLLLATSSGSEVDSNLYGSVDGGSTWQALAGKEDLPAAAQFTAVAIDSAGTAYVGTSDSFFAGVNVDNKWRWREVAAVPGASHIAFGATPEELFLSFSGSNAHLAACLINNTLGPVMEFSRDYPITAVTAHPSQSQQYYLVAESVYRVDCDGNKRDLGRASGVDDVQALAFWMDANGEERLIQAAESGLYERQP